MKLSEAILLGDSLKKADHTVYLGDEGGGVIVGCAIGGALLAAGGTVEEWIKSSEYYIPINGKIPPSLESRWPWLTHEYMCKIGSMYSCSQRRIPAYTLEQIADYVRSIEPAEEPEKEPAEKTCEEPAEEEEWNDNKTMQEMVQSSGIPK